MSGFAAGFLLRRRSNPTVTIATIGTAIRAISVMVDKPGGVVTAIVWDFVDVCPLLSVAVMVTL